MSRAVKKPAAATMAQPHYRRAAIAGALIAALMLVLDLIEDVPVQGDAPALAQAAASLAVAPAAEPAPAATPAPMITSISIPPPLEEESAPPPRLEPIAAVAATAEATDAAPAATPTCEPLPAAAPAPAASEPMPPPGNGYFIQLGVFGAQANAQALRQELAAAGTPAYLESRVVVGPYPNRKAADAARAELRRAGHPEGLLVPPRK